MTSSPQEFPASVSRAAHALATHGGRIAVAYSGGRDSSVLLHALHAACAGSATVLSAVHVHHGLSPNADAWAEFCAQQCAAIDVPLVVKRVQVVRSGGESTEAQARKRRFEALLSVAADVIALAHHADDQAETLLLQLLRGAGPHGLAAMVTQRTRSGVVIARPFLELQSHAIAAYAQQHGLRWIEDESNGETRYRRNALRHNVTPLLRDMSPGYPSTLMRAARHQAEAAQLLDALASIDARDVAHHDPALGLCLDASALRRLHAHMPARARNLVRWFLREHALRAPSTARLVEIVAQCTTARADRRSTIRHDGAHVTLDAGRIVVHRDAPSAPFSLPWQGEAYVHCPGGMMHATAALGSGIAAALVHAGALRIASRHGGERLRLADNRPRQAVSALFNRGRTPLWQRNAWPLVWHADVVIAVPGLGLDPAYAAAPQTPGYTLEWRPRA